jgi:Cu-Zn family superoxide dismutase
MRSSSSMVAFLLVASACHSNRYHTAEGDVAIADASAEVKMHSSTGESLGTLRLDTEPNGTVRLRGTLGNVPTGTHGIHIHAVGRCDPPTFESAGSHFNFQDRKHGLENPRGPHAGDAPNIHSDAERRVGIDLSFSRVTLSNAESGVLDADGAAVVIHANPDDQKTDPSGNSGDRIACGVISRR